MQLESHRYSCSGHMGIKSKAPSEEKIKFRENCIKFVANIISKLKKHSTMKYKFTWACLALSPSIVFGRKEKAKVHMFNLCIVLKSSGSIKSSVVNVQFAWLILFRSWDFSERIIQICHAKILIRWFLVLSARTWWKLQQVNGSFENCQDFISWKCASKKWVFSEFIFACWKSAKEILSCSMSGVWQD